MWELLTACPWNWQRGLVVNTFHGNDSPVHCVRESEGMLFVGNEDATITILDTKVCSPVASISYLGRI